MTDVGSPAETDPRWDELLADAAGFAEDYRERGWDAVVLEPAAVRPVDRPERTGLDVRVSGAEYGLVEELVESDAFAFSDAEVYYRPAAGDDRRFALAVERDEASETAVFVPLTYALSAARTVFETALLEGTLRVHVGPESADEWVVFSHDDPSLFLEESDVEEWSDS